MTTPYRKHYLYRMSKKKTEAEELAEILSTSQTHLAKKRWAKTTKKQRREHSRMMNEAKRKKRAKRA